MPKSKPSAFLTHVLELLRPMQNISSRAMFGGHGIYKDGKIFAIIVEDELYFKVTDVNRAAFVERKLRPFTYDRNGKEVAMSYYQAPPECLDDARFMCEWAKESLQ